MYKPAKKWFFFVPIIIGVLIFFWLKGADTGADRVEAAERATTVRYIELPELDVLPTATAYGSIQPATVFSAVAEVAGEVAFVHPKLHDGEQVKAGEVLLRIETIDYELAVAQAQAQVKAAEIQLAEFDTTEANNRRLLAIEEEALRISNSELTRLQSLQQRGSIARADVDAQTRSTLSQRQSVQSRQNVLAELPGLRALQEAELARNRAQLEQAQRNLERTTVVAPFDGRVAAATLDTGQYVRVGDKLFELDTIDRAEVSVHLSLRQMGALVRTQSAQSLDGLDIDPQRLLSAEVTLDLGDEVIRWPAEVIRLSDQIDPKTRTIGVVVSVDSPYANVQAGRRPPLVKGMFVKVQLRATQSQRLWVVPRDALHSGRLYTVDGNSRLKSYKVQELIAADDFVAIEPREGEAFDDSTRVVLSDLVPAIDQMLLNPLEDSASLSALKRSVSGEVTP